MIITQIEPINGTKSAVWIDGEFAFVLYKGEFRTFRLKEGEEIPSAIYEEIMYTLLPKRAKLRCMNLLQEKAYTRKQLSDKLKQARYPDEIIEQALAYVESFGYVDDAAYARGYVEDYMDRKTVRKMSEELSRKGIERDVIEEAVAFVSERDGASDEEAMIRKLLEKKNYNPEQADYKEKRKIQAYLYRKGFSADKIRNAMNFDEGYDL